MWRLVNPFEGAVASAAATIGVFGLLGLGTPSNTLTAVWPGNTVIVYFLLLLLGGLATLIGIWLTVRRDPKAGSWLWRAGLTAIASAWGIYGLALMWAGTGITAAALLIILTLATLIRIWQLSRPSE